MTGEISIVEDLIYEIVGDLDRAVRHIKQAYTGEADNQDAICVANLVLVKRYLRTCWRGLRLPH